MNPGTADILSFALAVAAVRVGPTGDAVALETSGKTCQKEKLERKDDNCDEKVFYI